MCDIICDILLFLLLFLLACDLSPMQARALQIKWMTPNLKSALQVTLKQIGPWTPYKHVIMQIKIDQNLAILAAILKSIPKYIESGDFKSLSDLFLDQEVKVATRSLQEAIDVSLHDISYYVIII